MKKGILTCISRKMSSQQGKQYMARSLLLESDMLSTRRNIQQAGQWNAVGSESGPRSPGSRALPPSRLRQRCARAHKNHPHVKRVVVSRRAKPLLLATRRTREREFWQLRSLYCKFISCFSWDRLRESGVGPLIYLRRAGV